MRDLESRRHQRINDFPLFMHMCDEYEGGTLVCGLMSHGIFRIVIVYNNKKERDVGLYED